MVFPVKLFSHRNVEGCILERLWGLHIGSICCLHPGRVFVFDYMEFCVQCGLRGATCISCVKSLVYLYAQGLRETIIVCRPCWAVVHRQCFIDGNDSRRNTQSMLYVKVAEKDMPRIYVENFERGNFLIIRLQTHF